MQSCYPEAISRVLKSEGGYVNHPRDPGGETMWGITVAVARANGYKGPMRTMPLSEAKRIYKARYADPCHFDDLPAGLDYTLLDYAVNSGVSRANKVLRRVIGLHDTAEFSQVLGQLSTREPKAVIAAVNAERLKFLQGLKTWPVFGKGWGSRVQSVNAASLAMNRAGESQPIPPAPPPAVPSVGKGEVPKPKTAGPVVATSVPGVTGSGFAWGDWISAHPMASVVIAVVAVVVIVGVFEFIARKWQAARQDAPTPGLVVVPEVRSVQMNA